MPLRQALRALVPLFAVLACADAAEATTQGLTTSLPAWFSRVALSRGHLRKGLVAPTVTPPTYYGQDHEDQAADAHYFHGARGGTFLELGALNGIEFSNTKYFEDHGEWRGVLIEPNPKEYAHLQRNRPNAICINAAICNHEQVVHFVGQRLNDSAGAVGGIWEFMSPAFRTSWYGSASELPADAISLSCKPLHAILHMVGVNHIDFFSLDVEGAELEVLKSIDFKAVHMSVVVIEQDGSNPEKDEAVRALLLANDFQMDTALSGTEAGRRNEWFVHNDFQRYA